MRKFFTAWCSIPLGLIFVVFAVANRHFVTVSFDPFNSTDPSIAVTLPLFVVIIAVAIVGRGGGRHARPGSGSATGGAPRASTRPMRGLHGRNWPICAPAPAASRYDQQRLPAPSQGGFYGAGGRDKQGATL